MPFLDMVSKLRVYVKRPNKPFVQYLTIKGKITPDTTYEVGELLNRVSKNSSKLGVVINSQGGDPSQAYIISNKLKNKAKHLNVELITFAEEYALNSAFFLLSQGNRVFVDRTTVIGGLEVGASKLNFGTLSQYITPIAYSQSESYAAELKKDAPFPQLKTAEMKQLFGEFSDGLKARILECRKNIGSEADLTKLYYGEEAVKLGIVDGIGRVHEAVPRLYDGARTEHLSLSELKKFVTSFRKMQFNS